MHLICDDYATHKHTKVRAWLARRLRYHILYTPTYASWLNRVDRWFGLIIQQTFRRGSFKSVPDVVGRIKRYTEHCNLTNQSFI